MGIRRRKRERHDSWIITYRIDGKRHTESISCDIPKAKTLAKRLLAKRETEAFMPKLKVPEIDIDSGKTVYFIEDANGGLVKIGYATDITRRLQTLQTATSHKLKLLGLTFGGPEKEKEIQEKFQHLRIVGEWFRPSIELLNFINEENVKYTILCNELKKKLMETLGLFYSENKREIVKS